jgi:hypothetical protein
VVSFFPSKSELGLPAEYPDDGETVGGPVYNAGMRGQKATGHTRGNFLT